MSSEYSTGHIYLEPKQASAPSRGQRQSYNGVIGRFLCDRDMPALSHLLVDNSSYSGCLNCIDEYSFILSIRDECIPGHLSHFLFRADLVI
jgi:hypothetical protein